MGASDIEYFATMDCQPFSPPPPSPGAAADEGRVGATAAKAQRRHWRRPSTTARPRASPPRSRDLPLLLRNQSSGSCGRSFASNASHASASSTKTHRRSRIEVGSLLFGSGDGGDRGGAPPPAAVSPSGSPGSRDSFGSDADACSPTRCQASPRPRPQAGPRPSRSSSFQVGGGDDPEAGGTGDRSPRPSGDASYVSSFSYRCDRPDRYPASPFVVEAACAESPVRADARACSPRACAPRAYSPGYCGGDPSRRDRVASADGERCRRSPRARPEGPPPRADPRERATSSPSRPSVPSRDGRRDAGAGLLLPAPSPRAERDLPEDGPRRRKLANRSPRSPASHIEVASKTPISELDAMALIQELSFDSGEAAPPLPPLQRTSTSASNSESGARATSSPPPRPSERTAPSPRRRAPAAVDPDAERGRMVPPASSPPSGPSSPHLPPLAPSSPPHIARLGSYASGDDDVPCQIMHNRNRARSTSISEMSDSYFQEFVAADPGDGNSSSASLSCSTHSDDDDGAGDEGRKATTTLERKDTIESLEEPPRTPSLAPRPGVSLWERGPSPREPFHHPPPPLPGSSGPPLPGPPIPLRARTSTFGSERSSYFSSSSSDGFSLDDDDDDASSGSSGDGSFDDGAEEAEAARPTSSLDGDAIDVAVGHLSLQEGRCEAYYSCDDVVVDDARDDDDGAVLRPRLDSTALRKWNELCEEEDRSGGGAGFAQKRFVFRALSCPNGTSSSPDRRSRASVPLGGPCDDGEDGGEASAEAPVHRRTPSCLSQAISQSLFSYTNSCAASTISSDERDLEECAISDLDFDIAHVRSHSLDNKSSSAGAVSLDATEAPRRGHRRCVSSGSQLVAKPSAPKNVPLLPDKARPPSRGGHRRFKSDGSILCKSRTAAAPSLSDFTLSFSEEPSFKSKYGPKPRHGRGKSLGSFDGSTALQCILEEASRGSNSGEDGVPGVVGLKELFKRGVEGKVPAPSLELGIVLGLGAGYLIGFLRRCLGDWEDSSVPDVRFALGLLVGLSIPHLFNVQCN